MWIQIPEGDLKTKKINQMESQKNQESLYNQKQVRRVIKKFPSQRQTRNNKRRSKTRKMNEQLRKLSFL